MKTTQEKMEVMKAYNENKAIQCFYLNKEDRERNKREDWFDITETPFNWENCDYRIKPERKMRPMTCQEILNKLEQTGFMLKHLRQNKIVSVVEVNIDKDYIVTLSLIQDVADNVNKDLFKNLLTFSKLTPKNLGLNYSFIDGTPISTEDINED